MWLQLFERNVLAALVEKEIITKEVADNILSSEHTGFSVFVGPAIEADDRKQRLFVARYLKKCPISNERLSVTTRAGDTTVHLQGSNSDAPTERTFALLEFLATLQCHLPSRWEQTSGFYGIYSCRSRSIEKLKAFITDPHEVARITKHLGLDQGPAPPQLPCQIPLAA